MKRDKDGGKKVVDEAGESQKVKTRATVSDTKRREEEDERLKGDAGEIKMSR